jgi:GNAT superfamily N-acetyltransferase
MNSRGHTGGVSATAPHQSPDQALTRETLREGDAQAIVELHRRVYVPEFGMNEEFVSGVAAGVAAARAGGWPDTGGAVWLVDLDGELSGSLALTAQDADVGRVRWFVLAPALRGRGLGRSLLATLLRKAREDGLAKLELETFSALTAAAGIYRAAGFRLCWEREREDWGARIVYQRYELELR